MTQPVRLVLLRHGQSEWNAAGIFTGWENAHLTAHGEAEAARAGSMLVEHGALPAFVHTSLQHRTIRTADLALSAADRDCPAGVAIDMCSRQHEMSRHVFSFGKAPQPSINQGFRFPEFVFIRVHWWL